MTHFFPLSVQIPSLKYNNTNAPKVFTRAAGSIRNTDFISLVG